MIFRRGDAVANELSHTPRDLCIQHGFAETLADWTKQPGQQGVVGGENGLTRTKSLFTTKIVPVMSKISEERAKTKSNMTEVNM
jgi:hypothetical protein